MAAPAQLQPTGSFEVDRVLGGGIVPGSVVLLGGDPGIGKSTIALQMSHSCGDEASPALYCTGEELLEQLALRARRLGCTGARVRLLVESDVDTVIATIEAERPSLVVVDSVQTLRDAGTPGPPGSVSQVRAAVLRMSEVAKSDRCPSAPGRACHEGGSHRRPAHPRAHGRRRPVSGRGASRRAPHAPRDQESLRRHRRGRAAHHGAPTACATWPRRAGACSTPHRSARPGSVLTITCDGLRPMAVEVQALAVGLAIRVPEADGVRLRAQPAPSACSRSWPSAPAITVPKLDVFVNVAGRHPPRRSWHRPRCRARDRRIGPQPGGVPPLRGHRRARASAARSAGSPGPRCDLPRRRRSAWRL